MKTSHRDILKRLHRGVSVIFVRDVKNNINPTRDFHISRSFLIFFSLLLTLLASSSQLRAQELPTPFEMNELIPQLSKRVRIYDQIDRGSSTEIKQAFHRYTNPDVIKDLENRLRRVSETGAPESVFSEEEYRQLQKNLTELRQIEVEYFEKWFLKLPMNGASNLQAWVTNTMSSLPQGQNHERMYDLIAKQIQENPLYEKWYSHLPEKWRSSKGPSFWGALLLRFSQDAVFRHNWIQAHPESLPELLKLSNIWAQEDLSIRKISVFNQGSNNEYWVIKRSPRPAIENPFELILVGNINRLISLEFASHIYFNRLSRISGNAQETVYHLEAVEKGRTMELFENPGQNSLDRRTFPGAELLRKSKSDELAQRKSVSSGQLNIFLGMRTIQINQIAALMKINPELVMAVGQVGFSVTGGRAQMTSVRTDNPKDQLRKMTATMIDIIEFSQVKNVRAWVRQQSRYLFRAVSTGVGSGGSQPVKDPLNSRKPIRSCRQIFAR